MYIFTLHLHSVLRYAALVLIVLVIYQSWRGYKTIRISSEVAKKYSLYAMISMHSQILIGILLFIFSPKVVFNAETMKHALSRFFVVEHPLMMLIAAAVLTVGHVKAKKKHSMKAHRKLFWYYAIALLVILISIPWPFRSIIGGGWL